MLTPSTASINDYASSVVHGRIVACEWVIKACQRHLDDLESSKNIEYPYYFDDAQAVRVINFIQLLPHTKGKWASKRQNLTLEPWQQFIVGVIFGWLKKSDNLRRFIEAYVEVARKNGKSIVFAAIGLYMMLADNEFGAEVYSGASTEKQAWEIFRPARLMAKRTPALMQKYDIEANASNLLRLEDYSRFEPLIGNPGDGASPSCAIADELHEHRTPDLYDTMQSGMGSREQPLMLAVTTAGTNLAGICYEKRTEVQKILGGVVEGERVFGIIYTLDEGDDFKDESVWLKANPNIDISVSRDYIASQVSSAVRSPSKQNAVKTKHFNLWSGARSAWLNMELWNAAADDSLAIEQFLGEDSYVGVDLAVRIDIASRGSLFRREIDGQSHYYYFPHFYLPEDSIDTAVNGKMYAGWAESGYIELMDGAEIGMAKIEEDIVALPETQNVRELVYDPWQGAYMGQNIRSMGMEAVEFYPHAKQLSPPMRELEAALASGRFHHPNNPVLTWMASNVVTKPDANSNLFPRKERESSKIDGMVTLIFALGRSMKNDGLGNLDDFLNDPLTMVIA